METIQDENREIWEVEIWEVPEEDVIAYLEEENKNNVNREQEDNTEKESE
jgi:hypothetical protein